MADAADFQFAIVGEDASDPAFSAVTARADKLQKHLGSGAKKTQAAFGKMLGPAKELAPGLSKALAPFEKLNRVRAGFADAFGRDGSTARRVTASSAASFARTSSAGGAMRASFVQAATGGRVLTGGLGQVGQAAGVARSGLMAAESAGAAAAGEVGAVGAAASAAEAGMGGAAAAAGGLATGLGAIALAVPAALAGGALLAAKYASPFARAGQEVKRTSDLIGMNAGALQRWRGAAERAGLSGDAATSGLANLGQDLHDLQYGQGDAVKAQLLTRMGVRLPKPGEKVDQDEVMRQISDKLAGMQDPYSRAHAARILGVEQMLPMLSKGRQAIQADMGGYDKTGAAFTDDELAKADAYGRKLTNFDQSTKGLSKLGAVKAMDMSGGAVDQASDAVQGMTGAAGDAEGALRALAGGAKDVLTRLLGGPAQAAEASPRNLPPRPGEPPRRRPDGRLSGEERRTRNLVGQGAAVPARSRPATGRGFQGNAPGVNGAISEASSFYRVSEPLMRSIAMRESGMRPGAQPISRQTGKPVTSATGLYQFLDQTWLEVLKKHGPEAGYGDAARSIQVDPKTKKFVADRRVMDMRFDPRANAMMGAAHLRDNQEMLAGQLRRAPTDAESYAAHFLGPTGGSRFVRRAREAPQADAAREFPEAAANNPGVFRQNGRDRSFDEVLRSIEKSLHGEVVVRIEEGRVGQVRSKSSGSVKLRVQRAMSPG